MNDEATSSFTKINIFPLKYIKCQQDDRDTPTYFAEVLLMQSVHHRFCNDEPSHRKTEKKEKSAKFSDILVFFPKKK